ncbi:MAG: hypothetical protein QM831_23860 [Kofleriaceae bacterium]
MSGPAKVLASTGVAVAAILIALFGMSWFTMHLEHAPPESALALAQVRVGLTDAAACLPDGTCSAMPLSNFDGVYPMLATFVFWISIAFGLLVSYQCAYRLIFGHTGEALSRLGYLVAIMTALAAILAGLIFAPETGGAQGGGTVVVARTWAPALLLVGVASGAAALVLAPQLDTSGQSQTMISVALATRPTLPSEPIVPLKQSRAETPIPTGPPKKDDRPAKPIVVITRPKTIEPAATAPYELRNVLKYATARAAFHKKGIDAEREDGTRRNIVWSDVVGVVARRLPPDPPYAGATFIDLVSVAGATLRFLPWTEMSGNDLEAALEAGDEHERARTLVQLIAMACPEARLDSATRTFLGGRGPAAQLPSEDKLAQHDERLA